MLTKYGPIFSKCAKICLSEPNPVLLNKPAFPVRATNVMMFTFHVKGTPKGFIKCNTEQKYNDNDVLIILKG